MASMLGHLFTLDSNRSLKMINMSTVDGVPVPNSLIRELPAHKDACLGVRLLPPNRYSDALFFTWSSGGAVLFWDLDGVNRGEFQVELEQPMENEDDIANELKVVRVSEHGDVFVTGDKYGVLRYLNNLANISLVLGANISKRVIDGKHRKCQYAVKAHAGEIMDIAVHHETIASCSRDRTVQVFHKNADGWVLTQTLDDHTASVSRVLLLDSGNRLLSCSADRTIVIRELCRREAINGTITMAYLPVRTLTTKASPVHMTPLSDSTLIVSTMDRQIQKFDLNTGKSVHCFRATDESGDAVVMDAVTVSKDRGFPRARVLAGISTTDKSIRLYDLSGNLIDKEWGHTEGVSDVALLEREPKKGEESGQTIVISTGTDGTIMIWGFTPKYPTVAPEPEVTTIDADGSSSKKEMTATRPPLRRVLSRTELMDFAPKQGLTQTTRPASAHTSSSSPPRTLRRKTSAYGMNRAAGSRGASILPSVLPSTASSSSTTSATPTPSTTSEDSASPSTPGFNVSTQPSSAGRENRKRTPTPPAAGRESRKSNRNRTPSPITKAATTPIPPRRSSTTRARTKSVGSTNAPTEALAAAGSMNGLAESLSRSLRSFRKKIDAGAKEGVKPEVMKELQRELGLTAKELGITGDKEGKIRGRSNGGHEGVGRDLMTQLLDTYSERLVSIVSEKLETKLPLPRERKKKVVETTGEG